MRRRNSEIFDLRGPSGTEESEGNYQSLDRGDIVVNQIFPVYTLPTLYGFFATLYISQCLLLLLSTIGLLVRALPSLFSTNLLVRFQRILKHNPIIRRKLGDIADFPQ